MERNIQLDWKSIVEEAVRRRQEQGLTQAELAVLAGVSKPTLNRFEQGRTNVTLENAFKVLRALGLLG
ncbi:MAG: XRE family transcriptional regulator [Verrucomicrobia bacterium CG_4_10_14_3_um_filter_43_23]|nr:MAG: transcriptional regulator [Verrucomicrobia bacterium CG22_combo_CG10-13_8_21_14_all_43_17]PIX58879.1 MAG: XRE family transcriptional regulator [Verrucomicrobia bacterium CG_4_10_14_3_um_filter_43_23]PIY61655.1 MAG: XRE family transcriptional regulator [Verrucomicrobia bacterium CG_4_10_14_0_8_um_filter_43_34]PJA44539.1 MAG: XRE family transcriptional regulator [Verrucomicrobia bacterium CG_4_9_14_3_um_filter_43_20]